MSTPSTAPGIKTPAAHSDAGHTVVASPVQRRWQIGLIAAGVVLLGVGGLVLLMDVDPAKYLGIAIWFVGALVLHDGVIAFAVFGISVVLRRVGKRIPFGVLAILQGAAVIGAIIGAIVIPEILKQGIGTANSTLLPLDYGTHLLAFYAGLVIVTALAIVVYLRVLARRQKLRPSSTQA